MNIVGLMGSPRKNACSSAIANRFMESATKAGASIQSFVLNELTYKGCQGCYACKKSIDHCILNDDLTKVLDAA
jgi:multimeric flavodoxin WrbA